MNVFPSTYKISGDRKRQFAPTIATRVRVIRQTTSLAEIVLTTEKHDG